MVGGSTYNDNVFINCPYDPDYARTFEALIFAVYALGFLPRAAREVDDGGDVRYLRIMRIIGECRYGIHDISRTGIDPVTNLPRFNMPLELGFYLAARVFGDEEQEKKRTIVLDVNAYRYRDFISDLAGVDIHAHNGDPLQAITEVRNWLRSASRRNLPSANVVRDLHERFRLDLVDIAGRLGFDLNAIPYDDFGSLVTEWLVLNPA